MRRRLIVRPLLEEREAACWATPGELAAAAAFVPHRRREYLAWRAVVREELGRHTRIGYDGAGAPVLPGGEACISVAHCRDRVAVCISDAPCAVDIEPESRDFSRVAPRYMTAAEQSLAADPLLPAVVWCAKEALYKYAGRRELDWRSDLHVERVDLAAGTLTGRIGNDAPVELTVDRRDGFVVVYIL